jgi:site-specific recombinase XerD
MQEDSLAKFRSWLRGDRGFSRRTETTYLAGAVRFVEWLDANSLLTQGLTSSRMKLVLRESRGRRRVGYKTQPIKDSVPLILDYYDRQPLPEAEAKRGRRQRLAVLRNRAMMHTLFATGLRAQELASLRRSDCRDGESEKILITGKGEKERVVGLNPEAQLAIHAYLRARDDDRRAANRATTTGRQDPLFVRHDRDELTPITTKTVWQIVNAAARALGLESTISPHDFRRYIATSMLSEGMPLESVQAFLGHESIVTTRTVYAHTWTEVLDEQVSTYRPSPEQALKRARKKRTG